MSRSPFDLNSLTIMRADHVRFPPYIPGLIQTCSPVMYPPDQIGKLISYPFTDEPVWVAFDNRRTGTCSLRDLRLDLANRTGRLHAAWWAIRNGFDMRFTGAAQLVDMALCGHDMTSEDVDLFARTIIETAERARSMIEQTNRK